MMKGDAKSSAYPVGKGTLQYLFKAQHVEWSCIVAGGLR